jgi:prephenate dehydrogenase
MNIAIIGVGLLGGSFALGLKSVQDDDHFIGVDNNEENAFIALKLGIVDEIMPLEQAVSAADLVVLATPVDVIAEMLLKALDMLPADAMLIDLGSTKKKLSDISGEHPRRSQYIACHPIAGTENSGPESAFAGLLKRKQMIICEKEKSRPEMLRIALSLFRKLDMDLTFMGSAEHDRHIAYVSHLSHISSFALGLTVLDKERDERSIFAMAGSGFSSTVRLAKSSPDMWAPIFSQNAKNVSVALEAYIHQLEQFKEIIDATDEQKSHALMAKANEIRRVLSGIEKTSKNQ